MGNSCSTLSMPRRNCQLSHLSPLCQCFFLAFWFFCPGSWPSHFVAVCCLLGHPLAALPQVASTAPNNYTMCLSFPRTVLFSTVRKPWSDVIPCNYEMKHILKELVRVKAFLLAGTTVTIVEEKVGRAVGSSLSLAGELCPHPFQ